MNVSTDPIVAGARSSATPAADALTPKELGREDFLKLLIAQLENQDPMKPNQDKEFVAQLATFSSLEQLISANANLKGLAVGQSSLINAQALNLIGKEALVESGDELVVRDGKPETLVYVVPRPAQSATLKIFGPDGQLVRELELDTTPGRRSTVEWDGLDEDDEPVPDGAYRFVIEARDAGGDPMSVARFRSLRIDGVNFGSDGIALISRGEELPFEQIIEIRAEQPAS